MKTNEKRFVSHCPLSASPGRRFHSIRHSIIPFSYSFYELCYYCKYVCCCCCNKYKYITWINAPIISFHQEPLTPTRRTLSYIHTYILSCSCICGVLLGPVNLSRLVWPALLTRHPSPTFSIHSATHCHCHQSSCCKWAKDMKMFK